MKNFFKLLQKDNVLMWSFWITLMGIILMCIAIGAAYTSLPPFVPLYNHMPWGYARIGKTYELFFLPASVLCVCVVNGIVGSRFAERLPLLVRFLFITMATLSFFTCIFVGRLIFLTL